MSLSRLIYVSSRIETVTTQSISTILEEAREYNTRSNITGMLCYDSSNFLQILEGEAEKVTELFTRIAGDSRHRAVQLIDFSFVSERRFTDWSMGLLDLSQLRGSHDVDLATLRPAAGGIRGLRLHPPGALALLLEVRKHLDRLETR